MARQLRIESENALYQITSRGNLRDQFFYDERDREKFLKILSERNREIGRHFGIKGSAVSKVIEGVEGSLGEEFRLKKETESLKEKLIIEF